MSAPRRPLRFGVLLPTREQAVTGRYDAGALLAFARRAEELGFDSLWAGDSLTARPRFDPLVTLSAAGAVTRRVTLGTAAMIPVLRHPLIGANMVAALDHVCGGRLTLGLGAGFPLPETEAEFSAAGVEYAARGRLLRETVSRWREAWAASGAEAGPHLLPPPLRAGGPPLWLAGSDTPRVLRRVAATYDGWLPFLPSADAYRRAWRRVGEHLDLAGRPRGEVVPALYATVTLAADRARAAREMDGYLGRYYRRSLAEMSAFQLCVPGGVEECAKELAEFALAGTEHFVLRVGSMDFAPHLERIATELLPAVRALVDPTG
ncbi:MULTISPECIES: LLM class flavin-dependent oxidoreductase [Kitasatospora]|uniref:Luciferase-like domain-containing protein n=1 Tax=Kitasatospora setae (strain ATCC 33774 / DSM 43861 / JCM 3304 / KCC A-0304 / NBRC 14216 / KM-6054) TaxID=452652 RepID=E4N6B5_KITSK|nr:MULTISPECIES: LLM class flavin-dependent oxidoreductase [Kitasatospora]BAJ26746.1 hypothetical protein KSE_09090 [Kitasatospora setae KM-6054]